MASDLQTDLTTLVTSRDNALVNSRDTALPAALSNLNTLNGLMTSALNNIPTTTPTAPQTGATTAITTLQGYLQEYINNLGTLKSTFTQYQKDRATCINAMIMSEAAIWCLACDPNYATKGVTVTAAQAGPPAVPASATVTYDSTTCATLITACQPFVTDAQTQNSIFYTQQMFTTLSTYNTKLNAIVSATGAGAGGGIDTACTAFTTTNNIDAEVGSSQATTPIVPVAAASCTTSTCPLICSTTAGAGSASTFLDNGAMNKANVAAGGDISAGPSSRLLAEESNLQGRTLQVGTWVQSTTASGVTVNFPTDPAGVNPTPTGSNMLRASFALISSVCALAFML